MKILSKKLLLLSIGFCILCVCCGEKEYGDTEQKEAKKLHIAVIPKGTTHEFWKSIHAGAVKASRELDVEVIWKGPQKEDDRAQQIIVVEDFINNLNISETEKQFAKHVFGEAKDSAYSIDDFAMQFYQISMGQPTVFLSFLDLLFG